MSAGTICRCIICVLTGIICTSDSPAGTASVDAAALFSSDEVLRFTLRANFSRLRTDDDEETAPYRPATLIYQSRESGVRPLSIRVKTRGTFRLERQHCRFPSLMLNFAGSPTSGSPFAGQQEVPLVVHCRHERIYEQYLLREYLAYRAYNLITDDSLRVRLALVRYEESDDGLLRSRYAFLVEHFESLADRLAAEVVRAEDLRAIRGDGFDFGLMYMFQFLIGNTDWSVVKGHNILLLRLASGQILPVPYDLDFSGAVNARYAVPDPRFQLPAVRTRKYRGLCEPRQTVARVIDHYEQSGPEIYALYRRQEGLSEESRAAGIDYLDSFFAILTSPEARQRRIFGECQ